MGRIPDAKYLKKNKVHLGPHALCYRCDVFTKDMQSDCSVCGKWDQVSNCVREWCGLCKGTIKESKA